MVMDDPNQRPRKVELFEQTFYDMGHFRDTLDEFVVVKDFEFEHIKMGS